MTWPSQRSYRFCRRIDHFHEFMRRLRGVRASNRVVWYVPTHPFLRPGLKIFRLGTFLGMLTLLLAALSVWISTSLVFGYIAWRLFVLIRADGRAGVSQWSSETKKRFRRQKKETEARRGRSPESVVPAVKEEDTNPSDTDQTVNETIKQ